MKKKVKLAKKPHGITMSFRIDPEVRNRLYHYLNSQNDGVSVQKFLSNAIVAYLNSKEALQVTTDKTILICPKCMFLGANNGHYLSNGKLCEYDSKPYIPASELTELQTKLDLAMEVLSMIACGAKNSWKSKSAKEALNKIKKIK